MSKKRELRVLDFGEIQNQEWQELRLNEVANIKMGFTPSTENKSFWEGDIPWLSIAGFQNKYLNAGTKFISAEALGNKAVLPLGSLVMSFKLTIGKLALLRTPMVTNEAICSFEWKNDIVNSEFAFHALSSLKFEKFANRAAAGWTLNDQSLRLLPIQVPPIEEQNKIVSFLSLADDQIELQSQRINLLKEQKKGYLQQVFSRELVFTDDNGNKYPEWEERKLGEVAKIKMGFTPSTENKNLWSGEIPWLSIAGFGGKYIEEGVKFISEEALGKKSILPAGSLVMSFKLTLGKLGIIKKPMVTNEAICSFEWSEGITTNEFAFYALSSLKFEKFANRAAAGLTLNDKTLKLLPIQLPSLPEQEKIAEFFSALDENIELNEQKLELLKEQKKGYLQGIFG